MRALRLFGDEAATRVFTTVGPEQEYFLIDERFYFERPDLITTGRTLFGAKPPKGHELDDHYFGSIPERVLACMLETEQELARLGVPIKTRHNEVAPAQYEVAPVFENSNVGSDHQQLTMQVMQNVARRYGLVCLLHEKPFAGVNGSGKHNNWSMGTDTGANLLEPGDTPHENLQFLFFCAAVHRRPSTSTRSCCARRSRTPARTTASGANEAPPAIISVFLGAELEKVFDAIEAGSGDAATPQTLPRARRVGAAAAARARRRPQPDLAVRLHRQQVRVPRARVVACRWRCPNTVLNTIVAEAIDELADELEAAKVDRRVARGGGAVGRQRGLRGAQADRVRRRQLLRASGTRRPSAAGWRTCAQSPDALPWLVEPSTVAVFAKYEVLSERELESRYEVFARAVRHDGEHRGRDRGVDRAHDAPAGGRPVVHDARAGGDLDRRRAPEGGARRVARRRSSRRSSSSRRRTATTRRRRIFDEAKYVQTTVLPAMAAVREVADQLERIVPDDLWPLPKYAEILFIK